jgi:alpha-N-acetylglucosaminidase
MLSICWLPAVAAQFAPTPIAAARQSLLRTVGPRAEEINLALLPARADGSNEFEIEANNGRLIVRGTSPVAICRGVYHYLRQTGTGMVAWSGARVDVPTRWPDFPRTRIHTPYKFIQNFNVVTFGYNTVFWDWPRWERELDWMALHGFNMALALNASEAIWQRVYLDMGITQSELDQWFTGPAFLPWFRMGNVYGWDGPLSPAWHRDQVALQHKILARMRELGIEPVAPAFAGFVPAALQRVYPNEKFIGMKPWCDFGGPQASTILDPQSKLYPELGGRFIREWQKEFGPAHYFLADSFNEMQVPVPENRAERLETLARFGRAVYDSIIAGNKDAVWVMQGWLFFNQRDFWDDDSVASLLSRVPNGRMMILDLACNYTETWRLHKAFHGKQWVFSFIPNMGGNTPWGGRIQVSASLAANALADPSHGNLTGFGIAYEGIENNEAQTELMTDAAWQTAPVDLDQWLTSYARARYGQAPPEIVRAWKGIATTAYNHFDSNIRPGYDHRPPDFNWKWGGTPTNSPELLAATRDFLAAGDKLQNQPLYRADMIELVAQVTGAQIDTLLTQALAAHKQGGTDPSAASKAGTDHRLADEALSLLSDLDRLLAAHPTHRTDRWIEFARNAASDPAEADRYEISAKRQITQWGPGEHVLNEYAAKQWNGIVAGYYRERWNAYFKALERGEKPDLDTVERRWIETVGNVPKQQSNALNTTPADTLKLARALVARIPRASATGAPPQEP